jgi:hypothetical protein
MYAIVRKKEGKTYRFGFIAQPSTISAQCMKLLLPRLDLTLDIGDAACDLLLLVVSPRVHRQTQAVALDASLPLAAVQSNDITMRHSLDQGIFGDEVARTISHGLQWQ